MEEEIVWHNLSIIESDYFFHFIFGILGIGLVFSIFWFIDGLKKYTILFDKKEDKKDE